MKHLIHIFAALLLLCGQASAQAPCLAPPVGPHTSAFDAEAAFNQYVLEYRAAGKHLNTDLKTLPVVVHILYDSPADSLSMAQVQSQITATNLDLRRLNADTAKTRPQFRPAAADLQVELCLAAKDPDGQATSGVVWHHVPGFVPDSLLSLMQQTQWPPQHYLNVWSNPGVPGGASTFAWQAGEPADGFWVGSKVFGTIGDLNPGQEGGGVFTHELGHYLGLYHTFHNSTEYSFMCNFPPCDSTGDRACDTPLDWDLPFSAEQCNDGQRFCDDGSHFFVQSENFMAYSNDTCTNMFSLDQRTRIRAALDSLRASLCSPENLALTGCGEPVATDELGATSLDFRVFPNPARESLTLHFFSEKEGDLLIFNALGGMVRQVKGAWDRQLLPLDGLPAGVYFFKLRLGGGESCQKVAVY